MVLAAKGKKGWQALFAFEIFFLMRTIFKVFTEFVTICFCFTFWFFGHETCGILAPQPGIEPVPLALEGEILTTELQRKSQGQAFIGAKGWSLSS